MGCCAGSSKTDGMRSFQCGIMLHIIQMHFTFMQRVWSGNACIFPRNSHSQSYFLIICALKRACDIVVQSRDFGTNARHPIAECLFIACMHSSKRYPIYVSSCEESPWTISENGKQLVAEQRPHVREWIMPVSLFRI